MFVWHDVTLMMSSPAALQRLVSAALALRKLDVSSVCVQQHVTACIQLLAQHGYVCGELQAWLNSAVLATCGAYASGSWMTSFGRSKLYPGPRAWLAMTGDACLRAEMNSTPCMLADIRVRLDQTCR